MPTALESISVHRVTRPDEREQAFDIRRRVFQEEQGDAAMGFDVVSEEFQEAGIAHRRMERRLP